MQLDARDWLATERPPLRHSVFLFLFLWSALALLLPVGRVLAQDDPLAGAAELINSWQPGMNMRRAIRRAVEGADKVKKQYQTDFKITMGYIPKGAFWGANLQQGGSVYESFTLEKGVEYAFLITGDDRARDLTLKFVSEASGKTPDTASVKVAPSKGYATVAFKPGGGGGGQTGRYRVVVGLKSAKGGESFIGMTILRQNGIRVPLETLYTVSEACLLACVLSQKGVSEKGMTCDFYSGGNTWAVYGNFLKPGEEFKAEPKNFIKGGYAVVAAADRPVKNIDARLIGGQEVSTGDYPGDPGVMTMGVYKVEGGRCQVVLKNASGSGEIGLVVGAALTFGIQTTVPVGATEYAGNWKFGNTNNGGDMRLWFKPDSTLGGVVRIGDSPEPLLINGTYELLGEGRVKIQIKDHDYKEGDYVFNGTLVEDGKGQLTGDLIMSNGDGNDVIFRPDLRYTTGPKIIKGGGQVAPSPADPREVSSGENSRPALGGYTGIWKGGGETGTLTFTLKSGGNYTGQLAIDNTEFKAPMSGTYTTGAGGRLTFKVKLGEPLAALSGDMALRPGGGGSYTGTLNLFKEGKKFGAYEVRVNGSEEKDFDRGNGRNESSGGTGSGTVLSTRFKLTGKWKHTDGSSGTLTVNNDGLPSGNIKFDDDGTTGKIVGGTVTRPDRNTLVLDLQFDGDVVGKATLKSQDGTRYRGSFRLLTSDNKGLSVELDLTLKEF